MKRLVTILLLSLLTMSVHANEYAPSMSVHRVTVLAGFGMVLVQTPPPQTCSYWGYAFSVDPSTPEGNLMFKMLVTAAATNMLVDIWYQPSAAPGTDQSTGCNESNMAVLTGVGLLNL